MRCTYQTLLDKKAKENTYRQYITARTFSYTKVRTHLKRANISARIYVWKGQTKAKLRAKRRRRRAVGRVRENDREQACEENEYEQRRIRLPNGALDHHCRAVALEAALKQESEAGSKSKWRFQCRNPKVFDRRSPRGRRTHRSS